MERRTELIELAFEQLSALLSVLEPGAKLQAAELLSGGRANTNYRLTLSDGGLRVVRLVHRDPVTAGKEALVLEELAGTLPLPRLLGRAPAGTAGVPAPALLLEHLPGLTLEDALLEDHLDASAARSLGESLGRALAAIHARRFPSGGDLVAGADGLEVSAWSFPGEVTGVGSYVSYCLDQTPAGERLGALKERVRTYFSAGLERWPDEGACLVHGDFKPCNLFVDEVAGSWELSGVLDWEFAHAGSAYSDYGNLFRRRTPSLPAGFEEAFLVGLAASGVVPPSDWALRRAHLDLTSALEFLSSEADHPQRHAASLAQVEATLALPLALEER
ncbi:MAG: phosphotransferase [Planctomycetes bacterium]|nr:phosphotransferase [Planctomycetota bacterium]